MATYYVDPSAATNGDGSEGSPFNTWASAAAIVGDGDTVLFRKGTVCREQIGPDGTGFDSLTFSSYGADGALPVISGADVVTDWVDEGDGVYSWDAGSNICGNVRENNARMNFVAWGGSLAATTIPPGAFSFDYTNFILYVAPTNGDVLSNSYNVSTRLYGFYSVNAHDSLVISGIRFEQASRHAVLIENRTNWEIVDCEFSHIGGYRQSKYLGNGLEVDASSNHGKCHRCVFEYIFDSGGTSQLSKVTAASLYDNVWENNTFMFCGLAGVELSTQTATQNMYGIVVRNNKIFDIGSYDWLSLRTGQTPYGVGAVNATSSTDCFVHAIVAFNDIKRIQSHAMFFSNNGGNVQFVGNVVEDAAHGVRVVESLAFATAPSVSCKANIIDGCTSTAASITGTGAVSVNVANNYLTRSAVGFARSNASASISFINNHVISCTGAFSGSSGTTVLWATNNVFGNGSLGATLDGSDTTTDPSPYMNSDYSLRSSGYTPASPNPLAVAGTNIKGTVLMNGRQTTEVGAYKPVYTKTQATQRRTRG